jgi:hypothetical protein
MGDRLYNLKSAITDLKNREKGLPILNAKNRFHLHGNF